MRLDRKPILLRPSWQKVLSDLWKNKTRSTLTILSISVGLLAIGVITNIYFLLNQDMKDGYSQINPANIQMTTSLVDRNVIKHLQNIDGVRLSEGSRELTMQVLTTSDTWDSINLQSRDFEKAEIGQVTLLEGIWPPQKNQIVLSVHKIKNINAAIGDWITLKDSAGEKYQLQVVGIIKDQMLGSAGGAGGFFAADAKGYINKDTLSKLHTQYPNFYNKIQITIDGDSTNSSLLNLIGDRVHQDLEKNGVVIANYSTRSSFNHPNIDLVNAIVVLLFMLTFLIVFLSGFLITNTLQFLLNQQMQQVGIMKTIGATRKQIVLIYVTLIAIFGVIAFFITLPATSLLTDFLMKYLADKINFSYYGFRNNPIVIIIQIIISMVVPQVAGIFPIIKGSSLSVQEALSGIQQQKKSREWKIERAISSIKGLSRPVLVAIRNVFRNKGRLILTLITLSMGGAVFISVFSVRASFTDYISQLSRYFLADLNISLKSPQRINKVEQILYSNPEVESVESWTGTSASITNLDGTAGDSINFTVIPNNSSLINPIMIAGRWLEPEDQNGIVLNEQFQTLFPDLNVGDTISLTVNNQKTDWVILGYFRLAGKLGGLASYANMDYFITLPGQVQNKAAVYRVVAKNDLDGQAQKQLAAEVQSALEKYNIEVSSIVTGNRINEASTDGFNILTTFLLILAILIALVGSIGLTGTMSMNIMERTREIGIMRSIGASDRALTKMVLVEGAIIGWMSWGVGALLSFPISVLMSNSITQALFGAPSSLNFSITGFVIWFVVVTILSVVSSIAPARNATRLTIREVLAYE